MFDLDKRLLGSMRTATIGFKPMRNEPVWNLACTGSCKGGCRNNCLGCKNTCKGKCKGTKKGK